MLEQEMPMAGCGPVPPYLPSDIEAWREQTAMVITQLKNHPSVVRYSMANEYYRNFTE